MPDQRVILVTGANRGIGYEAVKHLSIHLPNDIILLSSRSIENGEAAIKKAQQDDPAHPFDNVKVIELDITQPASLNAAVESIRKDYGQLTDLIHNTGIADVQGDMMSPEILDVNVKGARNTIEAFLPLIPPKTGRIALVSSEVGAWYTDGTDPALRAKLDDVASNDWPTIESYINDWTAYAKSDQDRNQIPWSSTDSIFNQAYAVSKALVTAWARHFAYAHPDHPIAIVCPGYCATDMNKFAGFRPASQGGASVVWPLLNEFQTGHFYQDGKDLPIAFPIPEAFLAALK